VAVTIECDDPGRLQPLLADLGRSLMDQGMAPAFLGAEPTRQA
jgi:hypothetical protein